MQICKYCFNDEEIRLAIRNESTGTGVCDACGLDSELVDVDFLSDFFSDVLALFEPSVEGINVVNLLQRDWNLFANDSVGQVIINHFFQQFGLTYAIDDKVDYIGSVKNIIQLWDDLKTQVKEKSRFFTSLDAIDKLQLTQYNETIPANTQLFRARIIPFGKESLDVCEMGCPPAENATAGRANPLGIPYLYLCQDEQTCYYEVRALYLDHLAIGTFNIDKELRIIDFTKNLSLYTAHTMASDLSTEVSEYKLIQRISSDLSKPLRRFDTELEYVPTQLICEYCKRSNIDGIRFNSALHKGGVNVVLFDPKSAQCTSVKKVEIKNVTISL